MVEHSADAVQQVPPRPLTRPGETARPLPARQAGWRRLYWPLAALLLVALAGAAIAWWRLGGGASVRYTTTPVSKGAVTRTVTTTGTVNPELTIIVGSYVSGVIQQLFCDYNTEVKTGQVCAKIDPRPYQTAVDQAKANLAIAKAQLLKDQASLAYAKVTFERNAKLVQTNAVSADAYDLARSNYDQAQAQVVYDQATIEQHQAALDAAQVNLDYTDITSPVDGTVVSRNVTMGQTVAASFQTPTLFLIASDLAKMQVDSNVSEGDIGGVKLGDKALFSVDAFPDRTFEATVIQVRQSPQTVQNVVTYDVVVGVKNPDLALKPGMTAAVRIITDQRSDVLRIPNQSLRYIPQNRGVAGNVTTPHVWVVRDGRPVVVRVETGLSDDTYTEVTGGDLNPADQVIVSEQTVQPGTSGPQLRF
jgi:HlyD family secretion protein